MTLIPDRLVSIPISADGIILVENFLITVLGQCGRIPSHFRLNVAFVITYSSDYSFIFLNTDLRIQNCENSTNLFYSHFELILTYYSNIIIPENDKCDSDTCVGLSSGTASISKGPINNVQISVKEIGKFETRIR